MLLERLVKILTTSWRTAPGTGAGIEQRRLPVHDGGCRVCRVTSDWREEISVERALSTLTFGPAAEARSLSIAVHPLSVAEQQSFSVEKMRLAVEQDASEAPGAGRIGTLEGRFGGGFYFSSAGEGRAFTRGWFLVKPLLLEFSIDTSQAALRQAGLELVRSARPSSA